VHNSIKNILLQVLKDYQVKNTLRQFITFAGVGAIGTLGHYVVLVALVQSKTMTPVYASTVGFTVGALINYLLNYRFTFNSHKRHIDTLVKFFAVAILGASINGVIMYMGSEVMDFNYLLVQVFATGMVVFLTFSLNKLWTFASNEEKL